MQISASTYKKIQSIKTWATNKLPTVTESSYTELLTDLLKYLDALIANNDLFETDIKVIINELNRLLNMTFPSQESINNAISKAKTEITTEYTAAIENSKQILDGRINGVQENLDTAKTNLQTTIDNVSTKIDTTMNTHKKSIKDTITGAMKNITKEG